MMEYNQARQQALKAREDTICFTREEVQTIIDVLKEASRAAVLEKQRRLFLVAYAQYRRWRKLKLYKGGV